MLVSDSIVGSVMKRLFGRSIAPLVGVLCALVLVLGGLLFAKPAYAEPLESVTVWLDAPLANGKNDTWKPAPTGYVSIPSDASYTIASVHNRWLNADGTPTGGYVQSGGQMVWQEYSFMFSARTRYAVRVTLAPSGDASFSEDTAVDTNDGVELVSKTLNDDGTLTVVINVACTDVPKTYINTVPITVTIPAAGMTVAEASDESSGIVNLGTHTGYGFETDPRTYYEFDWQNASGSYLAEDYQFEAGTTYRLLIGLITDSASYAFTNPTTVNVTGEGAVLDHVGTPGSYMNRSTLTVIINVTIPGDKPVTFDMLGHYDTTPETQYLAGGDHATRPEAPVAGDHASDYDTTGLSFRTWMNCKPDQLLSTTADKLSTEGGAIFDFEGEAITDATTIYASYDGALTTTAYDVTTGKAKIGGQVRGKSVSCESSFAAENVDTVIAGSWVTVYAKPDDGVEFLGWSTSTSEENIVSRNTEYRFEFTQATTLYALYKSSPVTITLKGSDINGESTISDMTIEVPYGGTYSSLPQSTKASVTAHFGGGEYLIGTNNTVMLMPNTLDSYSSWDEVRAADQAGAALTDDAILYIPLSTRVTNVELTLEAPICGTTYETAGSFDGQENAPQVEIPDNAHVRGGTRTAIFAMWTNGVFDRSGFVGTMVGGNTYHAHIWIEAEFGYFLHPRYVTLTINGEAPEDYSYQGMDEWGFFAAVEAEHDYLDEGEVTVDPTYDSPGEMTYKCKGFDTCGAARTEVIPPLDPGYTVTIDMDGHGDNIVVEHVAEGTPLMQVIQQAVPSAPKDDGYVFFNFAPQNVDGYTSQYEAAVASRELLRDEGGKYRTVTQDMTVHTIWFEEITDVEGTVVAPVCGTNVEPLETGADFHGLFNQTNYPVVTPGKDSHFTTLFQGDPMVYWADPESSDGEPFEGTITGGDTCAFVMYAVADYGYAFAGMDESNVKLDGVDTCAFGGQQTMPSGSFFPPEAYNSMPYSFVYITGTVIAEHVPSDPVEENRSEPTCVEPGSYDEVVYCSVCGAEVSREERAIDLIDHNWGEWIVVVEPTTENEGLMRRECGRCGETEEKPIDKLEPEPEPKPEPEVATLTFNLNGGTLDGQTGTITVEATVGDTITIPDAPTRDGYTFRYWQGSEYYPGDQYEVTGDHTFTAVWEQSADSDSESGSDSKSKPEQQSSSMPETGEPASIAGLLALLGGAMVAAGGKLRKR